MRTLVFCKTGAQANKYLIEDSDARSLSGTTRRIGRLIEWFNETEDATLVVLGNIVGYSFNDAYPTTVVFMGRWTGFSRGQALSRIRRIGKKSVVNIREEDPMERFVNGQPIRTRNGYKGKYIGKGVNDPSIHWVGLEGHSKPTYVKDENLFSDTEYRKSRLAQFSDEDLKDEMDERGYCICAIGGN